MSEKITNLTEQASGTLHDDDLFVNVDVSDTTMAATGTNKKSKWSSLKATLKTYFDSLYATATQGGKADTAVQPGDLGGAAALNVGTTAGTVAAGDHTHGDATTLAAGFMAATDKTKLDGIEIGADVTDAGNVAAAIAGAAGKTTPVDADALPLIDSAASNALKKLTWANLKAALKTYFDSLYALATHTHAAGDITSGTLDAARLPAPTTTTLGGVKRNTGTAGQFVTGIDSGGGLTYDTPAGVGANAGWTLISAQEVTSPQAAVTFDGVFSSTYDHYEIRFYDVKSSSGSPNLNMMWRQSSSDVALATVGSGTLYYGVSVYQENVSNTGTGQGHKLCTFDRVVTGTNQPLSGKVWATPLVAGPKSITFETIYSDNFGTVIPACLKGYNYMPDNSAMDGCKFTFFSGNIASGRFAVYGLTKA